MKFEEQIKHPNWQKKRLEILNRDNFKCRACCDSDKPLNVHHVWYPEKPLMIWECSNDDLVTLCENCHKEWHRIYDNHPTDVISLIVNLYHDIELISINKSIQEWQKDL